MQTVIVAIILVAAAGITVYRIFFRPSCGCGCGGKKKNGRPLSEDGCMQPDCPESSKSNSETLN
ncbi:MAG: hypothetical protein LBS60_14940 [Deltaproteobacteria bacterium]|nr:hypothetical protein [Deltaproteobacteria bacterium]